MRLHAMLLLTAGVVGAIGFLGAAPASACSCGGAASPPTESGAITQADAVFTGTVIERHDDNPPTSTPEGPAYSSGRTIRWVVDVDSVQKGQVTDPQDVLSAADEATCGYTFRLGTAYRIFASHGPEGLAVGSCGFTHPLGSPATYADDPPDSAVTTAPEPTTSSSLAAPPTTGPAPSPTTAISEELTADTQLAGSTDAESPRGWSVTLAATGVIGAAVALGTVWRRRSAG